MTEHVPYALLHATVFDLDGQPVPLAREWADAPVVLVLLRHFGCLFCKEQAAELNAIGPEVAALGARMVYVGSGSAQYARWFVEDYGARWPMQWPVYSDPQLETYRALGARRGWWSSINPRTWWLSLRALRHGFRQSLHEMGDQFQQGAVCVVLPDGSMPYCYLSAVAGDHPQPAEVLRELRAATAPLRPR